MQITDVLPGHVLRALGVGSESFEGGAVRMPVRVEAGHVERKTCREVVVVLGGETFLTTRPVLISGNLKLPNTDVE